MDATLAFALDCFQRDQTQVMQTEVAKIQAEREQDILAITDKHQAQIKHLQASAVTLRDMVTSIESIEPRLDTFCTEILATVVADSTDKLEAAQAGATLALRTCASDTAARYAAALQVELDESKTLKPKEEAELKQLLDLLAPGDGVEGRLVEAEAIMLGAPPNPAVVGGADVRASAATRSPEPEPQCSEGEPPSGHLQRFRSAIDRAEVAAQRLRHQAMAQRQTHQEWSKSKSKKGSVQRYLKLLGEIPAESAADAAAVATEAADGITAQSRQLEEIYRARSVELDSSKADFIQYISRSKTPGSPKEEIDTWHVELDTGWTAFDDAAQKILCDAAARGSPEATVRHGKQLFKINMVALVQTNVATGHVRRVRAPADGDASLDRDFQRWCDQTIEIQRRYDAVEVKRVDRGHRHKQAAMAQHRVESSKMLSSAVQQLSTHSAAGGWMEGSVAERIRAEAQAAEHQAEAAAASMQAEIDARKVVDVAFLSARSEDVADREPVPMHFELDADFDTWEGRKDAFLAQLAQRLRVPLGGITIANVRPGSIHIDLNIALPPGMALADFVNAARREAAQADADIRRVLLGRYNLELPQDTMDPRYNKEYGPGNHHWSNASPADGKDRGTEKRVRNEHGRVRTVKFSYPCPVGWKRYGLQIPVDFDAEYTGWPVAYHGTGTANAAPILNTALRQSGGAAGGAAVFGDGVYLTPSIRYASWERYAKWYGPMENGNFVQMAFQCRVNPRYIHTIARQTKGDHPHVGNTIDPHINNADMAWVVKPNGRSPHGDLFVGDDQVVCYGIMLREVAQRPQFPN